ICVAGHEVIEGSDEQETKVSQRHVRPVIEQGQISWTYLQAFQLGSIVDLGKVQARASYPEVEDVVFLLQQCRQFGRVTSAEFWSVLCSTVRTSLHEIFGHVLVPHYGTYYVMQGQGHCSLGELRLHPSQIHLFVETEQYGNRLRLSVSTERGLLRLPVTDVRFYRPPAWDVVEEAVQEMERMLHSATDEVILGVGLTRPFAPTGFHAPVHWLQVNNIHVSADPLWQGSLRTHQPIGIDLE
ncbi:MAG: hypothetical protein RMM08_06645, partial [Armatimonadota bacterium]|nr:hypothetical protein [bacterium]MDW8321021.1 hypothetical protein [Armatimonadota bacterium]